MMDIVQAQNDLLGLLLSYAPLAAVNIKGQRKMHLQNEVDYSKIYMAPRGGRNGAGVLVEMPTANCREPNVSGPVLDWMFPVVVVENPAINLNPTTGTTLSAEELAGLVMDCLHLYADSYGTFQVDMGAFRPIDDFPACVAYRVSFKIKAKGTAGQTPRCAPAPVTFAAGDCTLTCTTAGAQIYYTTDGSFPTADGSGTATLYTGPFPVQTGVIVRAVAYANGMNNSAGLQATAP